MAKIEMLKPFILRWEGGFVNDPADAGGATNKGVTIATFRQFFGENKTVEQLKNISDAQWEIIFRSGYWNPFKADEIKNQSIANICVDWAWASGTKTAIKKVQKIVGVWADGIVGNKTLAAINEASQYGLFVNIRKARIQFIDDIIYRKPAQKKFYKGWLNRINAIEYSECVVL